ncbi:hypothetical protein JHK84_051860 [Glycine max]|nr:hypothetical protein JHK86_051816 [Glycine max]KAG5096272.1 hypothetical protein JHK84_051860 [Glycine max]
MDPLVIGRVVGDVLEPFTSCVSLRILYDSCSEVINCCELKPFQIINQPRVEVGGDDFRTFYTLVMVDPDAPSPGNPNQREYLHWLVTNIPGTTGANFGRQTIYAPGWRQNFNTRDFSEVYNLGLPVAATYFNCKRQNNSARDGRRT